MKKHVLKKNLGNIFFFGWLHRKNYIKIYKDYNQFLLKKRFEVNIKLIFLVKKCEIQEIVSMIILTCSSEWFFKPIRYAGYLYVQRNYAW